MQLPETQNDILDLRRLSDGVAPGLSAHVGGSLAEAAAVCLEDNDLVPIADLHVTGDYAEQLPLDWESATDQTRNTHFDLQDATEDGACGVAILLAGRLLGKTVLRKSYKGKNRDHGFDYWLGEPGTEDQIAFAGDTRMEVSGILKGDSSQLNQRVKEKLSQVSSSGNPIPGIAIVIMFNRPVARIVYA